LGSCHYDLKVLFFIIEKPGDMNGKGLLPLIILRPFGNIRGLLDSVLSFICLNKLS
jgi:hypothetical protein